MVRRHTNQWEREQALEFYRDGVTINNLALWFDRGRGTISQLIKRSGAKRGNPDFNTHPLNHTIKAPRHGAKGIPKHRQGRSRPVAMEARYART